MSVVHDFKKFSGHAFVIALASASAALMTGCGVNNFSTASTPLTAFAGTVHGGQSPIQGSTVRLFVTNAAATGYGQAGTLIGSATTDAAGGFTISPSATAANCPAGQQAYITSAGGYPSGAPTMANSSSLLMAALGNCATVNANTYVIINEVTTVAAGYALSGFMTTSTTLGVPQANVSAPAANNAGTGSGTAAAGLAHAFLNASLLASNAAGSANSLTPNINMGGTIVNGSVPFVEINTLGDILQSCVNGATGNTQCTSLFADTPSISGVAPTNTLQAMINLARNPYPSTAAMTGTTSLFSLASSQPAFQPTLTAAPPDWSMAIVYKGTTFPAAYDLALDANDTVYVGAAASPNILAMSAYGTATPAFTAGSAGTATRQLALDTHNNVWVTNNGSLLMQYNATTGGAPTNLVTLTGGDTFGVAVDGNSNVWLANAVTTTPNITEFTYPGYAVGALATAGGGFEPVQLSVDATQNIWTSAYYTGGSLAQVLPNLTPTGAASYAPTGTTTATPVTATFNNSAIKPLGVVLDASGNAWYGITGSNSVTTTGLEEVVPNLTNSVITALTPQTLIANATLGAKASQIPGIDGAGTIYLPDNQGAGALGIHVYSTASVSSTGTASQVLSPPSGYLGCYLATTTTTVCATGAMSAVYNPREIAIDSTGSVWGDISTTGGLTQIIGLGAPTWPLLATTKPGVSPGLTTATPLP